MQLFFITGIVFECWNKKNSHLEQFSPYFCLSEDSIIARGCQTKTLIVTI